MHTERALFFDINRYFFLQLLLEKQITSIKQIFCSFLHFFRSVLARNSALPLAFRQPWMPFCLVHSRRLCLEKRLINGLLLIQSHFQNIPNTPSIILIFKSIHQWWIQGTRGRPSTPLLFFNQNEARRAEKNFFWRLTPPTPAPPPHLKVWIYHCNTPSINLISKSIYIKSILHLPNLVSAQVVYEELAGGFKPIRNGEIF